MDQEVGGSNNDDDEDGDEIVEYSTDNDRWQ